MFNIGDTFIIEGYIFRLMKLRDTRGGLAYRDSNGVTHIRWVPLDKLAALIYEKVS